MESQVKHLSQSFSRPGSLDDVQIWLSARPSIVMATLAPPQNCKLQKGVPSAESAFQNRNRALGGFQRKKTQKADNILVVLNECNNRTMCLFYHKYTHPFSFAR
jgi:hypothetical protein